MNNDQIGQLNIVLRDLMEAQQVTTAALAALYKANPSSNLEVAYDDAIRNYASAAKSGAAGPHTATLLNALTIALGRWPPSER